MPDMVPKSRAAGSATSLVAALDPKFEGEYLSCLTFLVSTNMLTNRSIRGSAQ